MAKPALKALLVQGMDLLYRRTMLGAEGAEVLDSILEVAELH
jgi:hypothetical protein